MVTLNEIQTDFETRVLESYRDRKPKYKPTTHWASNIGHVCPFFLWARWIHWAEWPPFDDYMQGVFAQGKDGEKLVQRDLLGANYGFTHQEERYYDESVRISGRIDGKIDDPKIREYVKERCPDFEIPTVWGMPAEIKNVNDFSYDEMCGGFRAMLRSYRPWVRKYPMQTLAYGKLMGEPCVAMIPRCKSSRQTTLLIERVSDYNAEIASCRRRLQYVNQCLDDGTKPEPIEYDHMWCSKCKAWNFCPHSGGVRGVGIELLNDDMSAHIIRIHDTIEGTRNSKRDHDAAKKELRTILEKLDRLPKEASSQVVTGGNGLVVQAKSDRRNAVRINVKKIGGGE